MTHAPASVESVMTNYPSRATFGVAAHYVVYRTQDPGAPARLTVLQAQTSLSFLAVLHAQPIAGAIVTYPDGSIQHADAAGAFDAAASGYARRHPQQSGQPDVAVRVASSDAGTPLSETTHVFAPSRAVEAMTASGTIAALPPASAATPSYAFSCDPGSYAHGIKDATAGSVWKSPTFIADSDLSYYPVFGFCGVEQSFLDDAYVTVERHWSQPRTIEVSKPIPRGCPYPGNCTVLTWSADATFNSSVAWGSHALVALWFESWYLNVLRVHSFDMHSVLLRVH